MKPDRNRSQDLGEQPSLPPSMEQCGEHAGTPCRSASFPLWGRMPLQAARGAIQSHPHFCWAWLPHFLRSRALNAGRAMRLRVLGAGRESPF